ncbi:MAG: TIGR04076 family protein [Actinobacteria bacterium]|nr:TIGR04076 family protein [Actinomycetota bacterium]
MEDPGDLVIRVVEVKGRCPAYEAGDTFRIERGFMLNSEKPLCMHSLASLLPYYVALSRRISPKDLGLCREGDEAFLQCLDPCGHTGGGTALFAVRREGAGE